MFKFEDNKNYRMPPYFGGTDFRSDFEVRTKDIITMKFTITTDKKRLADYLPEGFQLLRPELTIGFSQLKGCEFLFGGGYNLLQVDVPVRFNGKCDKLEGSFPLVIWENNTRPIFGGREESGQPKIYADLQDINTHGDKYFTNASYNGNTFLRLEMHKPQPVSMQMFEQIKSGSQNYNIFGWRYIPKIGAPGADLSQPVLYPQSMSVTGVWVGGGSFQWQKLNNNYQHVDVVNQYTDVPSQYEIIKQLSELPVPSTMPVMMVSGSLVMKPYAGRVLE